MFVVLRNTNLNILRMRKVLFLLVMCLTFVACNTNGENKKADNERKTETAGNYGEVLYFHGKQRCATCIAIDKNAKAAVEERFAPQIKNGSVVYKVVDISKSENEGLAEKYEVTWSALFVVKHKDGKETFKNMTVCLRHCLEQLRRFVHARQFRYLLGL